MVRFLMKQTLLDPNSDLIAKISPSVLKLKTNSSHDPQSSISTSGILAEFFKYSNQNSIGKTAEFQF